MIEPVSKEPGPQQKQTQVLVECLGCHKLFPEKEIVRCYDCGRTFCEECAGPAFSVGLCSDCEEVFEAEEDYYGWT
jgi:hypothetical protein